jgi:hypothetical protein
MQLRALSGVTNSKAEARASTNINLRNKKVAYIVSISSFVFQKSENIAKIIMS